MFPGGIEMWRWTKTGCLKPIIRFIHTSTFQLQGKNISYLLLVFGNIVLAFLQRFEGE